MHVITVNILIVIYFSKWAWRLIKVLAKQKILKIEWIFSKSGLYAKELLKPDFPDGKFLRNYLTKGELKELISLVGMW